MSFYSNLVNGKYNTYEKVASVEGDTVEKALSALSTEQLNALAEELDVFNKEASEINLESAMFEEEEYITYDMDKEAEEVEEVEEVEETEESIEAEEEVEVEDAETEEVEESIDTEEEAEIETHDEELEVEACEEDEFEIIKEACEQVGNHLVENGLTVTDYVRSLTGLEKEASHIGDMAEKVAMVYDIPVVMAARDLVSTMVSLVDEE